MTTPATEMWQPSRCDGLKVRLDMSTQDQAIIDQLVQAVDARRNSLAALRERIANLLATLPVGVKLSDDAGLVCKVVRVVTGASQWANRTWDVTIKGTGYLTEDGKLLAVLCDQSYWDGSNMHHRSTEPYKLSDNSYDSLQWPSGAVTRALAARLPAAIARYMAECEAETTANSTTL